MSKLSKFKLAILFKKLFLFNIIDTKHVLDCKLKLKLKDIYSPFGEASVQYYYTADKDMYRVYYNNFFLVL